MDRNTNLGDAMQTADTFMRRTLAVVLAVFIALVVAVLILAEAGLNFGDNIVQVIGFALIGVLIWRYAQRDQYRAESAGDKSLIITTLAEDIVLTGGIIFFGGIGIGLFSGVAAACVHAGGAGGAVAYYIGRRIWVGDTSSGSGVETL